MSGPARSGRERVKTAIWAAERVKSPVRVVMENLAHEAAATRHLVDRHHVGLQSPGIWWIT